MVLLVGFVTGFPGRKNGETQIPVSTPDFSLAVVNQPEFQVNPTVEVSHQPFIVHCWDPVKQEFKDREDHC
jgi:hypothetical protein